MTRTLSALAASAAKHRQKFKLRDSHLQSKIRLTLIPPLLQSLPECTVNDNLFVPLQFLDLLLCGCCVPVSQTGLVWQSANGSSQWPNLVKRGAGAFAAESAGGQTCVPGFSELISALKHLCQMLEFSNADAL